MVIIKIISYCFQHLKYVKLRVKIRLVISVQINYVICVRILLYYYVYYIKRNIF